MPRPAVVQVQFTPEEAEYVRRAAESAGLSQSAFVRRIVMNKIRIRAWWVRPFYNKDMKVMALRSMGRSKMAEVYADVFLELVSEGADGAGTYRVFGDGGRPLQLRGLEVAGVPPRDLPFGRLMLAGDSYTLWRVARSVEDNGAGDQLVWSLIPDRRAETEPADLPAA